MGEKEKQPFQLSFNSSLRVDFQGSRVTSAGGLLLERELDERLGLSELISEHLTDGRRGKNTQFKAPMPSEWTLMVVESRLTAPMRMRTICSRCNCSKAWFNTPLLDHRFMRVKMVCQFPKR